METIEYINRKQHSAICIGQFTKLSNTNSNIGIEEKDEFISMVIKDDTTKLPVIFEVKEVLGNPGNIYLTANSGNWSVSLDTCYKLEKQER